MRTIGEIASLDAGGWIMVRWGYSIVQYEEK